MFKGIITDDELKTSWTLDFKPEERQAIHSLLLSDTRFDNIARAFKCSETLVKYVNRNRDQLKDEGF